MKIPEYFYFRVHVTNKGTAVEIEDASDIDIAEIVRCADCIEYAEMIPGTEKICLRFGSYHGNMKPMDYCSRGVKKDA